VMLDGWSKGTALRRDCRFVRASNGRRPSQASSIAPPQCATFSNCSRAILPLLLVGQPTPFPPRRGKERKIALNVAGGHATPHQSAAWLATLAYRRHVGIHPFVSPPRARRIARRMFRSQSSSQRALRTSSDWLLPRTVDGKGQMVDPQSQVRPRAAVCQLDSV
jgi:hypothetical protein